jgi:predicted nucleic acid-binding protein
VIVIDASALVELLIGAPAAAAVDERLFRPGETLHGPHLLDIEVVQVLRRHEARRQMEPSRCREALDDLTNLRLLRYPHDFLLPRVWELRNNLSAYDALYVSLAEFLNASLVTRDRRLANASGHRAQVDLI